MSFLPQHIPLLASENTWWGRVTARTALSLADEAISYPHPTPSTPWEPVHVGKHMSHQWLLQRFSYLTPNVKKIRWIDTRLISKRLLSCGEKVPEELGFFFLFFFFHSPFLHLGLMSYGNNHPQVHISFFAFTWWFTNIFSISSFFKHHLMWNLNI